MKKIIAIIAFATLPALLTGCEEKKSKGEQTATAATETDTTFVDSRDSKTYKKVTIGKQMWMAENLNYNAEGSKCYENDEANCKKYGRLYDWNTAMKSCPSGWHLPSNDELEILEEIAGSFVVSRKLKTKSGWDNNSNGTDEFGFSALPGGYGSSGDYFSNIGDFGIWWKSIEYNRYYAYKQDFNGENAPWNFYAEDFLFSVRCVKD